VIKPKSTGSRSRRSRSRPPRQGSGTLSALIAASASPPSATRLGYRPALDGLRAVAITLVLLGHIAFFLVPSWNGHFFRSGFLGVDLFFVLSGFLITTLLLERHDREPHPIGRFYLRRALRLMPALVALLTAVGTAEKGMAMRMIGASVCKTRTWASASRRYNCSMPATLLPNCLARSLLFGGFAVATKLW